MKNKKKSLLIVSNTLMVYFCMELGTNDAIEIGLRTAQNYYVAFNFVEK